jgi:hypothetical protein
VDLVDQGLLVVMQTLEVTQQLQLVQQHTHQTVVELVVDINLT